MNPFAVAAVKLIGAGGAAALLSAGAAGVLAQAASPAPNPTPTAGAKQTVPDSRSDRRAIRRAVVESEADVLGIPAKTLRADLFKGETVAELAKAKGLTEDQFESRLVAILRPQLETLVDHKVITQAQADRVIDRIQHGHVPFWNGIHRRK